MQQENEDRTYLLHGPISDVWRELLGNARSEINTLSRDAEPTLPVLKSDPWGELLQSRDVEIINAQQLNLHMSDQDVELALQVMQEDAAHDASRDL